MDKVEGVIKGRGSIAGLQVDLLKDYGAAQNLYIKRGYVFDSKGVSYNCRYLEYGDKVMADDDLCLGMFKKL